MVFFTTRCRMLESVYKNKGLVNMVEITEEFQCFFVRPPFKLYFRLRPATKSIKTASGAPRPKSAPRGSKATTFASGQFQVSNPQQMVANPIGDPSVSPLHYPIY